MTFLELREDQIFMFEGVRRMYRKLNVEERKAYAKALSATTGVDLSDRELDFRVFNITDNKVDTLLPDRATQEVLVVGNVYQC